MSSLNDLSVNRRDVLAGSAATVIAASASAETVLAQSTTTAAANGEAGPPASAASAAAAVEANREVILRISREVWELAELSLAEIKSAAVHVRELKAAGFQVTSVGTSGTPTAFVAEWMQGSGGAKVGFLPEYDALPGLGNAAEPRQTPAASGIAAGHGCGHNMIGAGCTGATIALKAMMEQSSTPGTIRVYGCAAEETEGVKVYMARDGLFDDVDACIAFHPAPIAATGPVTMNATNNVKLRFRGRTAHAGNSPWDGRSALKAAELCAVGIQMMREHILPTARIHYIYENAGVAPNVIPEFAEMWVVIRDKDRAKVEGMTEWMKQIALGAAMATQTEAEVQVFFGMYDLLPNDPMIQQVHRHMLVTPLDWSEEEQGFARACQKAMNLPEAGMAAQVMPILPPLSAGASTDIGDISYITPVGIFGWPTLPLGVSLHTWPVTACGGMSIGDKASLATAKIMAGLGFDVLTDPELRKAAKEDLVRRTGGKPFVSPLPKEQTGPIGLPPELRKTGEDDFVSPLRTLV